jgi:hypothetical protein
MSETATIQFYEVEECGYFKRGEDEADFGSLSDTLYQLEDWASQEELRLVDTQTYTPGDSGNLYPAYCFNIIHSQGRNDYLLTTWNRVPSTDEQIASARENSQVGEVDVELTDLPENSIPGYATYFWFIPEDDRFATIQFDRPKNGHPQLKRYLTEFLAKFTSYVVEEETQGDELEIEGYREHPEDEPEHYYPRFTSVPSRTEGQIDLIRERRPHIRKIIRKNRLGDDLVGDVPLTWKQTILRELGLNDPANTEEDEGLKTKYEVSYEPNEGELDDIIENWEENHDEGSRWHDVGFRFKGQSSKTYWLSNSLIKQERDLDVDRINEEVVGANSLLQEILDQRQSLLAPIPG